MSRNNLNESLRNEIRTSGGFDLIIDAGKFFLILNRLFSFSI
jgi:hypothetical protein